MRTNKIYKGDAYELIKQVEDKSVDLIITDPPYEMGKGGMTGIFKYRNEKGHGYYDAIMNNNLDKGIDLSILDEFVRVLKKINIYIWCNKEQIIDYLDFFVKKHHCNWEMIIWGKCDPTPFCCGHYLKDKEYCLFFWETGATLKGTFETMKTIYFSKKNKEDGKKFGHPTIKDLSIIKNLILNSSRGGNVILDPFLGSGTTAVACKELGRQFIGFEINDEYYNIACDRLNGIDQKGQTNLFETNYEQLDMFKQD